MKYNITFVRRMCAYLVSFPNAGSALAVVDDFGYLVPTSTAQCLWSAA